MEVAGIFYHVGENEMSMPPYRKQVPTWLNSLVKQSRIDLASPQLRWYVSQQPPTDHKSVNSIDVTSELEKIAAADSNLLHTKAFDLPPQKKELVLDTAAVIQLGQIMAETYLSTRPRITGK